MTVLRTLAKRTGGATADVLRHAPGSSAGWGPIRHRPAVSIQDWLSQGGATAGSQLVPVFPAAETLRTRPVYADPPVSTNFDRTSRGKVKPGYVGMISQGRYWGRDYGLILTPDDYLLSDLSLPWSRIKGGEPDGFQFPSLPPLERVTGTAAVINTYFASNYHHFLLDTLPKFGLLIAAGFPLESIDYFVLPVERHAWHAHLLKLLNIPESKIIGSLQTTHLQADRLLVPSYTEPGPEHDTYDYSPFGLNFVRDLVLNAPHFPHHETYPKRVLLTRERTKTRRLMPEDLNRQIEEQLGFTRIFAEDLTVSQQAACFAQAEVVVMPTGGGLASAVFCRPGALFVELFSPYYYPSFSIPLTSTLGVRYAALVGDAFRPDLPAESTVEGNGLDIVFKDYPLVQRLAALLE